MIKTMENHATFPSVQQTPSFPYETGKIQNGYLKTSASESESPFECTCRLLSGINRL